MTQALIEFFLLLKTLEKMSDAKPSVTLEISVAIVHRFWSCIETDLPLSKSS